MAVIFEAIDCTKGHALILENDKLVWKKIDASLIGSYECVGPKLQKNPHGFSQHCFIRHGSVEFTDPRLTQFRAGVEEIDADLIRDYFQSPEGLRFEGLVIHCILQNGAAKFFKLHRGHIGLGDFKGKPYSEELQFIQKLA